jgi:molybdopterin-guanine dinucleotide biosynthesis protein A
MGSPKPTVEVGGVTMFGHVTAALESAGLDVLVVGSGVTPQHSHPTIADPPGAAGPVAGIAAALEFAGDRPVVVVATDQPYLSPSTVRRLLSIEGDLVAPLDGERVQVTCAVYRHGFAERLAEILASDPTPSLQEPARAKGVLVERDTWSSWGEDGRSWRSLDTPESVATAVRDLGEPVR